MIIETPTKATIDIILIFHANFLNKIKNQNHKPYYKRILLKKYLRKFRKKLQKQKRQRQE